MGGVSKAFGSSREDALFKRKVDTSSQMRVSKALFQNHTHMSTGYRCAKPLLRHHYMPPATGTGMVPAATTALP